MSVVTWTVRSLNDLDDIYRYVERFNRFAAISLRSRLKEAGDALRTFPYRGTPVRHNLRETAIVYPYIIRYQIIDNEVTILRVRHGKRRR